MNNYVDTLESCSADRLQIGQLPLKGRIEDRFRGCGLAKHSPQVTVPGERIVTAL